MDNGFVFSLVLLHLILGLVVLYKHVCLLFVSETLISVGEANHTQYIIRCLKSSNFTSSLENPLRIEHVRFMIET